MRNYETMFILKPTLTEEEINAKVELFKSTLEKQGASIEAVDMMGSRQLAYKIEKFERGYYVVIYFKGEGTALNELERVYRITEDVIRFIVIKYEKQVEVKAWENMVKKAKGEPHQEIGFVERERRPRKPRTDYKPRTPRDGNRAPRDDNRTPRDDNRAPREDKRQEAKEEK